MNIEPSISAHSLSETEPPAPAETPVPAKSASAPTGYAPVIGVVAMMAVALPLVLGLQGHPRAANLVRSDAATGAHHPTAIQWHTGFETACQIALAGNKMVMIAFFQQNCAHCQRMDSEIYSRPPIVAAAQTIVPLKIDGEAQPEIAMRYGVQKYPTIVWTDATGVEKHRFEGTPSGFELYQLMEHHH